MNVVVCCATRRGVRFLERLHALLPDADVTVFSFPEEPHEPAFLEDIRRLSERNGWRFMEARGVGAERLTAFWEGARVDLLFAVSWRYMIPPRVYEQARFGAYVFHDSMLPAYRGFSPTVWAILNGEDHTGVSLIRMAEAVDAGEIVDQERVPITQADTIADVLERVTDTYLDVLERNLPTLAAGQAVLDPQDEARATYCCRRLPEDNEIDWTQASDVIYNLIRAVTKPYPGAYTYLGDTRLVVWEVERLHDSPVYVGRVPGRVVEIRPGEGAVVLTGDGSLLVRRIETAQEGEIPPEQLLRRTSQTLGRRGAFS